MSTSGGQIGFIGLGNMGAAMAVNLLKARGKTVVYDVSLPYLSLELFVMYRGDSRYVNNIPTIGECWLRARYGIQGCCGSEFACRSGIKGSDHNHDAAFAENSR